MNERRLGLCCGLVVAVFARQAWSAERPLVVVESTPGVGIEAPEVRRTISAELGSIVHGPRDGAADDSVLIVALDRGEVRMSFRTAGSAPVSRAIAAPDDRAARLRTIAWLAGNLVRDQVTPAMAAVPRNVVAAPAGPTQPPSEVTPPPPVAPTVVVPAPVSTEPPRGREEAILARASTPAGGDAHAWAFTLAGGVTTKVHNPLGLWSANYASDHIVHGVGYQLDVQRQPAADGLILGGGLEVGPTHHLLGLSAFVGKTWRRRSWFVEATAGAGIEVVRTMVQTVTFSNSSATGQTSMESFTLSSAPALFARAALTFGIPVTSTVDLVARGGIHLSSTGFWGHFGSVTVGPRFTFR